MVATIVFPILLSVGVAPLAAGCLFLFGMSIGGVFNLVNWQLYTDILKLPHAVILRLAAPLCGLLLLAAVIFAVVHGRAPRRFWAGVHPQRQRPPWYCLLTPLVPLAIVLPFAIRNWLLSAKGHKPGFEFPIITALLVGLVWGVLTARANRVQLLTRSVIDGIAAVAPAVGLMLRAIPSSALGFVATFGLLAPLALYRGPLNLWGMGAGLVGAILATGRMSPGAVMAAFFSVGLIQGVCDPTNTHNVWIASHLDVDVQQILKRTLPYVWAASIAGLAVGAALFLR
jgi:hypothetical protein